MSKPAESISTEELVGDAKVEPVTAPATIAGKTAVVVATQSRAVTEGPYSAAKAREKQRTLLATALVGAALLAATGAGTSAALGGSATHEILSEIFTPLLGLAGAVVGFYFGGKDSTV